MDNFLKTLFRLFEEKFPSRIKIVRNKSLDNTYITIKILYEQRKMHREYSKHLLKYGETYRRICNQLNNTLFNAKVKYYKQNQEENSGDCKKL